MSDIPVYINSHIAKKNAAQVRHRGRRLSGLPVATHILGPSESNGVGPRSSEPLVFVGFRGLGFRG